MRRLDVLVHGSRSRIFSVSAHISKSVLQYAIFDSLDDGVVITIKV